MREHGSGFSAARLARSLANPSRYWSDYSFESEEAALAIASSPACQERLLANPLTEHTTAPPESETFDLVLRIAPR